MKNAVSNPYYLYAAVWSAVLALYELHWSSLYAPLDLRLTIFLVGTIVVALALGYRMSSPRHEDRAPAVDRRSLKRSALVTATIVLGFAVEFAVAGHIPLVEAVLRTGYLYTDFTGIKTFHVLLITFSTFYLVYLSHIAFRASGTGKWWYILQIILVFGCFGLLLDRGVAMYSLLMIAIVYSRSRVLNYRHGVAAVLIVLAVMYAFGGLGNVRLGFKFSDNSYFTAISKVDSNYPRAIPGQFLWGYMYAVSPLGNLNNAVIHEEPENDVGGLATDVVPDFISKRVFPAHDPATPLVIPHFTVSTGYASAWKFMGMIGLVVMFLAQLAIAKLATRYARSPLVITTLAIAGVIIVGMFFTNTIAYSALSFAIVYPLLLSRPWLRRAIGQSCTTLLTGGRRTRRSADKPESEPASAVQGLNHGDDDGGAAR